LLFFFTVFSLCLSFPLCILLLICVLFPVVHSCHLCLCSLRFALVGCILDVFPFGVFPFVHVVCDAPVCPPFVVLCSVCAPMLGVILPLCVFPSVGWLFPRFVCAQVVVFYHFWFISQLWGYSPVWSSMCVCTCCGVCPSVLFNRPRWCGPVCGVNVPVLCPSCCGLMSQCVSSVWVCPVCVQCCGYVQCVSSLWVCPVCGYVQCVSSVWVCPVSVCVDIRCMPSTRPQ